MYANISSKKKVEEAAAKPDFIDLDKDGDKKEPMKKAASDKIMKEEGIHEGCIEQIQRLFQNRLYTGSEIPTDEKGRIRIDDWEMKADVQDRIKILWEKATTENLSEIGDLAGYKQDFLNLFGFGFEGVDYNLEANELVRIPSI
jgi:enoyl-[acyl-carrier protein] reductase/trans-2-enoyl-CoA reductase (NAD+)